MSKTLGGQVDVSGDTFGTLEVLRPVRVRPRISYEVKCTECNSVWSGLGNEELKSNPKCINAGCGKKIFRSWKEEYEHERDETLRKVEGEYKQSLNELARLRREYVLKAKDDEFLASQELRSIRSMPSIQDAIEFTRAEAEAFVKEHGDWYHACPENHAQICAYLERQGIDKFCDRGTFSRAAYRLQELGLLKPKPAPPPPPEPEPEPVPEPEVKRPVNTKALLVKGVDDSGREKFFTQKEVNDMDSETYRKAFMSTVEGLSRASLDLIPLLQGRLRA